MDWRRRTENHLSAPFWGRVHFEMHSQESWKMSLIFGNLTWPKSELNGKHILEPSGHNEFSKYKVKTTYVGNSLLSLCIESHSHFADCTHCFLCALWAKCVLFSYSFNTNFGGIKQFSTNFVWLMLRTTIVNNNLVHLWFFKNRFFLGIVICNKSKFYMHMYRQEPQSWNSSSYAY